MKPEEQLRTWLIELGIDQDEASLARCVRHLRWVIATNHAMNLTSVVDFDAGLRLHLLDSLAALPEAIASKPGPMVDLGTGGGFPGLPLSLASSREVLLVDSVAKKLTALERFIAEEGLGGQVLTYKGRSEDLALKRPNFASIVVARAVAELPVLIELASPLLVPGGVLVALKARPQGEELERSLVAAQKAGFGPPVMREFLLPGGGEERVVVTYAKTGAATVKLPRRPGVAKKRPLG